jgi:hypothetical protein
MLPSLIETEYELHDPEEGFLEKVGKIVLLNLTLIRGYLSL